MKFIRKFIKGYFTHFSYFYTHLRNRLFVALILSLLVGVLDGFGLAMFLPLLQMVDGQSVADTEALGNLSFLLDGLADLGISLTASTVLIVILVFFTLKGIAKFFESYYKVLVQQHFIKKIRTDNVNKLSNYSYRAFVQSDSGKIQNTMSGEVVRVVRAYQSYFLAVQAGVLVSVYIGLAILSNPQFAVLVAIGGALTNLVFNKIYKKTKETSRKISSDGHIFQGLLIQQVTFFKYLKATGLNRLYSQKLIQAVDNIESNNKKIGFYNSILTATREPLVILVVVIVIVIQITYFSESLGLIILSLLFFYRSLTFLMILQTQWNNFLNVSGSLENMTEFMTELNKDQDKNGRKILESFNHSIKLNNIYFNYGETSIIKNVSLKIKKNEAVAFVGESGSGKTTLVNIVTGLVKADRGEILIDGLSTNEIDINSLQQKIGYITQEPVIFNDNIFNNVTLWAEKTEANLIKFWGALRRAAIDDFVKGLPEQENAKLGNNGIMVSGGQKQRLSIARELYKDIEILIMDEATSALDSETENIIQTNIEELKGEYTILIVAHRLATIKNADKIVLLDNGIVTGIGSFNNLFIESEAFNRMVSLQEI